MMDVIKKVPLPIWIGLGMVLILIVVMANRQSQPSSTVAGGGVTQAAGPVTTATVGTQGAQSGAGTDQALGNLSVMMQSGFSQLSSQDQAISQEIAGGMTGVGTPMQQFGGSIQNTQNNSAASNASNGTVGQNAGNNPSAMPVTSTSSQ